MTELSPLRPDQLARLCDPDSLGFESTDQVPPLDALVGQDRALAALELGLGLDAPGYNVYVAGPTGSGRTSTVRKQAGPEQVATVPLKESGEPMSPDEFERLAPPLKADLQLRNRQVQQEIDKAFQGLRRLDRDTQAKLETLGRQAALAATETFFETL